MSDRDKQRFVKLTHGGRSVTCTPAEAAQIVDSAQYPDEYAVSSVWMTPAEYEALPEFAGW